MHTPCRAPLLLDLHRRKEQARDPVRVHRRRRDCVLRLGVAVALRLRGEGIQGPQQVDSVSIRLHDQADVRPQGHDREGACYTLRGTHRTGCGGCPPRLQQLKGDRNVHPAREGHAKAIRVHAENTVREDIQKVSFMIYRFANVSMDGYNAILTE